MPIYEFRCPKCNYSREVVLSIEDRNNPQACICGEVMGRKMSVPQPPIMKLTGNDMALNSLNSKDTAHMKPGTKELAAQGLERPQKTIY